MKKSNKKEQDLDPITEALRFSQRFFPELRNITPKMAKLALESPKEKSHD